MCTDPLIPPRPVLSFLIFSWGMLREAVNDGSRCILYIVMNKSSLSILAYKAIYKYLQQPLDNLVKEKYIE